MIWLLLLPIRLVVGLLSIPFLLLRLLLKIVGTLVLLPIVLVLSIIGFLVGGVVLFVPIVLLGLFVWGLVRLFGPPLRSVV